MQEPGAPGGNLGPVRTSTWWCTRNACARIICPIEKGKNPGALPVRKGTERGLRIRLLLKYPGAHRACHFSSYKKKAPTPPPGLVSRGGMLVNNNTCKQNIRYRTPLDLYWQSEWAVSFGFFPAFCCLSYTASPASNQPSHQP